MQWLTVDAQFDRGYCIGLALEFEDFVMAFLSIDQVFQVCPSLILCLHNEPTISVSQLG